MYEGFGAFIKIVSQTDIFYFYSPGDNEVKGGGVYWVGLSVRLSVDTTLSSELLLNHQTDFDKVGIQNPDIKGSWVNYTGFYNIP